MSDNHDDTSPQQNQNNENENFIQGLIEEPSSSRGPSVEELRSQPRSQASMARRLVSQSTFQEHELDNSVLNSQQEFIDLSSDSDSDEQDKLFEEYLLETAATVNSEARLFNDELPMEHSYLGPNMDTVRGSNYYEPGKIYELSVCSHHSMVFPGEILPMIMVDESMFERTPDSNEGLTFGVVFTDETESGKVYGVTCHVFEKGLDNHGHITVKSKAHQRFIVVRTVDGLTTSRNQNYYAKVKILPDYILPDPINLSISNSMLKFINNPNQSNKMKSLLTSSNRWPKFVYDQYSTVIVNEKVERFLAMLNISNAPTEPVLKSFWLARNIPLNQADRLKIFTTNCVNKRMLLLGQSLNFMCFFSCKRCRTRIASYSDIFAMARGNVNANYCNPAGYIHETLTVHKTIDDSARIVDRPSTEFSWFPGYAWQIAVCKKCSSHIGWKFIALEKNLKPKTFFGLSCKSLVVSPEGEMEVDEHDDSTGESSADDN